jgi:CTP:molybdopterin cytidylyltransferase MocA
MPTVPMRKPPMTVAAVILAATADSALADADGTPVVRRLADVAWAGGATPVVVIASDPGGAVGAVLANAEVTLAEPAAGDAGSVAQVVRGMEVASSLVAGSDAALLCPARMAWVDAETVTSLLAAHGVDRVSVIRPVYGGRPGWPALLPAVHLETIRTLEANRGPSELLDDLQASGIPVQLVETGDPGTVMDISTPRHDLPPFDGPAEPSDGHVHEWGEGIGDQPDDAPVEGPARVVLPPDHGA